MVWDIQHPFCFCLPFASVCLPGITSSSASIMVNVFSVHSVFISPAGSSGGTAADFLQALTPVRRLPASWSMLREGFYARVAGWRGTSRHTRHLSPVSRLLLGEFIIFQRAGSPFIRTVFPAAGREIAVARHHFRRGALRVRYPRTAISACQQAPPRDLRSLRLRLSRIGVFGRRCR